MADPRADLRERLAAAFDAGVDTLTDPHDWDSGSARGYEAVKRVVVDAVLSCLPEPQDCPTGTPPVAHLPSDPAALSGTPRAERVGRALLTARYGEDRQWESTPRTVREALLFDASVVLDELADEMMLADTCDLDTLTENATLRACIERLREGWVAQPVLVTDAAAAAVGFALRWQRGTSALDDIEPMAPAEQEVMSREA